MSCTQQLALSTIRYSEQYRDSVQEGMQISCPRNCKKLLVRSIALATCPILYPLSSIAAGISRLYLGASLQQRFGSSSFCQVGQQLKQQLATLNPSDKNSAIKMIRCSRFDNPSDELQRLMGTGTLTTERLKKIGASLDSVGCEEGVAVHDKMQATKLIAQALEIKDLYRESHFVFPHAQAVPWMIYSSFIKELVRKFYPEKNIHNFKFLRLPPDTAKSGIFKNLFTKMQKVIFGSNGDVRRYLAKKREVNDSKWSTQTKLLSVDGYFYNYSYQESSLHFLLNNTNIVQNPDLILKLTKAALKAFCSDLSEKTYAEYAEKLSGIWARNKEAPCGNFFAVCIPKEKVDQYAYRSHDYGPPCNCHPATASTKILSLLQQEVLNHETKCTKNQHLVVPQYRLFMPAIGPEKNIDIHCLSPLSKATRRAMKCELKALAEGLYRFRR